MGIRLFFIGLIVTALAGGGFYVMKLQKDNAILKANAIKMESAIADQKTLIENQKKDFEAILVANKEMNELIGNLKKDFADLDKRFNKKNRDVADVCLIIKKCNIDEISKYLLKQGQTKKFPDITTRE